MPCSVRCCGQQERPGPCLVEWIIDAHGVDVNGRASRGDTALYAAATPLIARALLERHADPILVDCVDELCLIRPP